MATNRLEKNAIHSELTEISKSKNGSQILRPITMLCDNFRFVSLNVIEK